MQQARWSLARTCMTVLALVVVALMCTAGAVTAAEDPENIDVTIARSAIVNANSNNITIDVVIKNAATGKPPATRYGVFLNARQGTAEPILEVPENCVQQHDADPAVPPGVYRCSIIVDNPGTWTFTGYVNLPGQNAQRQLRVVETTFDVPDAVVLAGEFRGLRYVVVGRSFEVFLLQTHVVLASLWLFLVGALAFVAVPALRRKVSTRTLQWLEVRRGFLASCMWVAFGGTVLTGTWLLNTQTAYKSPFSTSRFSLSDYEDITRLPYASFYFDALYLKIFVFMVMAAASVLLASEAGRQAQAAEDAELGDEPEIDMWASGVHFTENGRVIHTGATATEALAPAMTSQAGQAPKGFSDRILWACVAALVVGSGTIGVCVTILKYCHELIETANAARILGR